MNKDKRNNRINKIKQIAEMVDQKLDSQNKEIMNIFYFNDFEFQGSGLAKNNVYIVEISNQNPKQTVDTYKTYEIYDKENEVIAIVDKYGRLYFSEQYLGQLKNIDEQYFEILELDELYFELPEELKENDLVMTKEDIAKYEEKQIKKGNTMRQEELNEELKEEEKQEKIAKTKGISVNNVLRVKENSNLYKDHPNLEPNLYFYRGTDGVVKAEYIDKNGNPQTSKYFEPSTTSIRQETIDMGDDGNPVEKEVPYQVMRTKGLAGTDKDVRDVRININIDSYGYLEISEARQGMNGQWASHDIEVVGRKYNSYELNEETSIRTRKADPDKQTGTYAIIENTGLIQDGVQYDEMYLIQHSEEIIEEFVKEGYSKDEAIEIFNYMIGEQALTEEQAKEKVNENIKEREDKKQEKQQEIDDEERTPWGDAEKRRSRY